MTVRPSILRHYYEATFDGRGVERFKEGTFDEYYELVHRELPAMTKWHAADAAGRNGRPDLLSWADRFEEPTTPIVSERALARSEHPRAAVHQLIRKGSVYLESIVTASQEGAFLEAQGTLLTGWAALARAEPWHHIDLRDCRIDPDERIPTAPLECGHLNIIGSKLSAVATLALATRCRSIRITFLDEPLDLQLFAGHSSLEALTVSAEMVYGARHLRPGIRELRLSLTDFARDLRDSLPRFAATLTRLSFTCSDELSPDQLPALPRLTSLGVPAFPAYREPWLRFATENPHLFVEFGHPGEVSAAIVKDDPVVVAFGPEKKRAYQWMRVLDAPVDRAQLKSWTAGVKKSKAKATAMAGGRVLVGTSRTEAGAVSALAVALPAPGVATETVQATPVRRSQAASEVKPLGDWEGEVSPTRLRKARLILEELASGLAAASTRGGRFDAASLLRKSVRDLNSLDRKNGNFIGTIEAEDLHAAIGDIANKFAVPKWQEIVDSEREW